MFIALTNLGAGGIEDVALADTANATLYGVFALAGFVSGGICNSGFKYSSPATTHQLKYPVLGPPLTLSFGTLGYALYVGALWWCVL